MGNINRCGDNADDQTDNGANDPDDPSDVRSADDRRRGEVIAQLLCHGEARLDADLAREVGARLAPFTTRGLAEFDGAVLRVMPGGRPTSSSCWPVPRPRTTRTT